MKRGNANGRRLEVVLLFFLLAFSFFLYANPINTGFVTLQHTDPELEISLSRDYYKSNETIDGNITINFKGPINMHTNLTVEFRDYTGLHESIENPEMNPEIIPRVIPIIIPLMQGNIEKLLT